MYYPPIPLPPDALQRMQANNQSAALVESYRRLDKAERYALFVTETQAMRQNLAQLPLYLVPSDIVPNAILPDSLPASVRDFISAVARKLGVPDLMVFGSLLGAAFCAARGNFLIKISEDYQELLTGYIVIAAESGQRKSAVSEPLRQPFKNWETEAQHHAADQGSASQRRLQRRSLQKALKTIENKVSKSILNGASPEMAIAGVSKQAAEIEKALHNLDQKECLPRLLLQTATLEALPERMAEQGGFIGLWSDEGGFWKKYCNARGDDVLLQAYVGNGFSHSTKTAGSCFIESPCLALLSLVQPSVVEDLYGKTELERDGLLPRILPILCPPHITLPSDFTQESHLESMDWYHLTIKLLLGFKGTAPDKHAIVLDDEAKKILLSYQQYNSRLFPEDTQGLVSFRHKLAGHAARIAGALHLLQHPLSPQTVPLSITTMQAGIDCANLFLEHAKVLFDPSKAEDLQCAHKIIRHILKRNRPQCTVRELCRGTDTKVGDLFRGLKILEKHNVLMRHYGDQGRVTCIVHPEVFQNPLALA